MKQDKVIFARVKKGVPLVYVTVQGNRSRSTASQTLVGIGNKDALYCMEMKQVVLFLIEHGVKGNALKDAMHEFDRLRIADDFFNRTAGTMIDNAIVECGKEVKRWKSSK